MIRQAVGALVFKGDQYMMVRKVRCHSMDKDISGHWDFPKGGLEVTDLSIEAGLLRELKEETGSEAYRIVKEYKEQLCFDFPPGHKYQGQVTHVFLVEYLGTGQDLQVDGYEISDLDFYSKTEFLNQLSHKESRDFMKKIGW